MLSSIEFSVDDGLLSLSVAPYDDVRETTSFVMSCLLGVAFVGITCTSFDLVNERLKVCIDDVRDFELILVILENEFVIALSGISTLMARCPIP